MNSAMKYLLLSHGFLSAAVMFYGAATGLGWEGVVFAGFMAFSMFGIVLYETEE